MDLLNVPVGPDEIDGLYGSARRMPVADQARWPATMDAWLITAPRWHPLWSQYMISVITLADVPGVPPAVKLRAGVTHEVLVMAIDPTDGPYTTERISGMKTSVPFLRPGNIGEQFTATDKEAVELAPLCARAVVDGLLNPETADAPEEIRAAWARSIRLTLDHGRDPHHGGMH